MKFKNNLINKNLLISFTSIAIIFIFFSNNYFSFENSLIYGAADGKSYMEITKNFPYFKENGYAVSHNQRFLFPYLVGSISYITDLDPFSSYRLSTSILLFVLIYLLIRILNLIELDIIDKILALGLIIFNPYIFRYYLALPTLINDVTFLISVELLIFGFLSKNKKITVLGMVIGIFSRQTAIFYILGILINKFIFKNSFFNKKDIFFIVILFTIIYFLNHIHGNIASGNKNLSNHSGDVFGLIFFVRDQLDFNKLILFLLFPLLTWGPMLIVLTFRKIKNIRFINELNFFIIICSILIFAQPILAGPITAGKNIIRLTNLAYPFILILIMTVSYLKIDLRNYKIIIVFLLFILWSLHPTYSVFNFFDFIIN